MAEDKAQETHETYDLMPEGAAFERGFNLKTVWGALFVGFIMLPGAIYLGLVMGQGLGGGAAWVTIILFIEIAKRCFVRLKTQEIIILYWVAGGLVSMGGGVALPGGPFATLIWDQYFVQSPQTIGLREYIPRWVAPSWTSDAIEQRTFLHMAWLKPMALMLFGIVFGKLCSLSMGYVLFRIVNDLERLPFPMSRVHAGGATALAETSSKAEGWRWRVFSIGSFVGAMFGLIYVVVPALSGIFLTDTVQILPIPFIDFTPSIKAILPATALGLMTNLGIVLGGFVLPFWVVVGTFATSMIATLVANPMLYNLGILHSWAPGMSSIPTRICNDLDFWLSYNIGKSLLVAVLGFGMAAQAFMKGRVQSWEDETDEGEMKASLEPVPGRGDIPIWVALAFWAFGTLMFVLMVRYLVPEFPWWICALFGFIWTPVYSYVCARLIGLTGSTQGVTLPYIREGSFYLSGYKGAAVWFAPIPMHNHGPMVDTFKQLDLTKCKFISLVWLSILTTVVMLFCSFIFWSMIWRLGPVPSSAYPFVQKMWPFHATMRAIWVKSTIPERKNLFEFEGSVLEKYSSSLELERVRDPAFKYATRETLYALRANFSPEAKTARFSFKDLVHSDWVGYRWLQIDAVNESGQQLQATVRITDLTARENKAEPIELPLTLKPGKNVIGVELAKPEDPKLEEIGFVRQLPSPEKPTEADPDRVRYVPYSTYKREADMSAVDSVELIVANAPAQGALYLDSVGIISRASAFILRIINWRYILVGFGVGTLLYAILTLAGAPALLFYGCVGGIMAWPHHSIPLFIGAMLGRYYFARKFGERKWRSYAPILLAGYACGSSLIGMTSIAIVLIAKSISQVVF